MSFIERLNNKQKKNTELRAEAGMVPISLPEAMSGLGGSFREPNRVSRPLGSQFTGTPTRVPYEEVLNKYRG